MGHLEAVMTLPCYLGYGELQLGVVSVDAMSAEVYDREYILFEWARVAD